MSNLSLVTDHVQSICRSVSGKHGSRIDYEVWPYEPNIGNIAQKLYYLTLQIYYNFTVI